MYRYDQCMQAHTYHARSIAYELTYIHVHVYVQCTVYMHSSNMHVHVLYSVYIPLRANYLAAAVVLAENLIVTGWLVDWFVGCQLVDYFVGWLVDWFVGCQLVDYFVGWLVDYFVGWLVDYFVGWPVDYFVGWLVDYYVGWFVDYASPVCWQVVRFHLVYVLMLCRVKGTKYMIMYTVGTNSNTSTCTLVQYLYTVESIE